jgi:UDP-glucose 4-epimerase
MKVLVTGGAGYIGSVATEVLLDDGHDVLVFDSLARGHRAALDPRARFVEGDLQAAAPIAAAMRAFRPDAVMHFAALALVGESMREPGLYFANNVGGGLHLLDAMRQVGTRRIVFSSTCATYGFPERVPIPEDAAQRPVNPYGASKLMFEQVLDWYAAIHGMEPVMLRYFNACGATERFGEDHDPETHLIPTILKVALGQRERVQIFGADYATPDGTCIRDYIHIVDLARAHVLALESAKTGAFNLGTGGGCSVREVIAAARAVTGHAIPEEVVPRRPGDPDRLVASAERARYELGWVPRFPDLPAMIESAWRWHRAHPHGYGRAG